VARPLSPGFIRNKAVLFSDCVLLLQPCHLPINPQKRSAFILQRVGFFYINPRFSEGIGIAFLIRAMTKFIALVKTVSENALNSKSPKGFSHYFGNSTVASYLTHGYNRTS
jgi:hypothetical protein